MAQINHKLKCWDKLHKWYLPEVDIGCWAEIAFQCLVFFLLLLPEKCFGTINKTSLFYCEIGIINYCI